MPSRSPERKLSKRASAALAFLQTSQRATLTRRVWCASSGTSLPLATMAMVPSATCARPNGGTDHPISTCRVMICVSVPGAPPFARGLASTPACFTSARTMRLVDDPGEENATLFPAASFNVFIPLSAPRVPECVACPRHFSGHNADRGAFSQIAPNVPSNPLDIAMSTLPDITASSVPAPPSV